MLVRYMIYALVYQEDTISIVVENWQDGDFTSIQALCLHSRVEVMKNNVMFSTSVNYIHVKLY